MAVLHIQANLMKSSKEQGQNKQRRRIGWQLEGRWRGRGRASEVPRSPRSGPRSSSVRSATGAAPETTQSFLQSFALTDLAVL